VSTAFAQGLVLAGIVLREDLVPRLDSRDLDHPVVPHARDLGTALGDGRGEHPPIGIPPLP